MYDVRYSIGRGSVDTPPNVGSVPNVIVPLIIVITNVYSVALVS